MDDTVGTLVVPVATSRMDHRQNVDDVRAIDSGFCRWCIHATVAGDGGVVSDGMCADLTEHCDANGGNR